MRRTFTTMERMELLHQRGQEVLRRHEDGRVKTKHRFHRAGVNRDDRSHVAIQKRSTVSGANPGANSEGGTGVTKLHKDETDAASSRAVSTGGTTLGVLGADAGE